MPSNIKLSKFRKLFARYGIRIEPAGKHLKMRGVVNGKETVYPLPTVNGREVKSVYVTEARKVFLLTPKHGVSDEDFFS